MNSQPKRREQQDSVFIGEVSNPLFLPDKLARIEFELRPLQGDVVNSGAA